MNIAPISQFLASQQERIQPLLIIGGSETDWSLLTVQLQQLIEVDRGDTVELLPTPSIAEVRQIMQRIQLRPLHGSRTLVIFHQFERWSPELATTILKTIEEPPAFATLVLYAGKTAGILPTIRSRVATFRLATQSDTPRDRSMSADIATRSLKDQFALIQKAAEGDTPASVLLGEWIATSANRSATRQLLKLAQSIGDAPVNRRLTLESAALLLRGTPR